MRTGDKSKIDVDLPGKEFLYSVMFLYGEALRIGLTGLADVLERTFDECAEVLESDPSLISEIKSDHAFIEFHLIREFRKLDHLKQIQLIDYLGESEGKIIPFSDIKRGDYQ